MGNVSEKPWLAKNPESGSNKMCNWGVCAMQGWKMSMEDTYIADSIILPDKTEGTVFGVFDGHGGSKVAEFAKD